MNTCPCCSGTSYDECCRPFHKGKLPENALQLMRSRYSAYTLGLVDYIVETTHPASPQYGDNLFAWKRNLVRLSQTTIFQKLEVLDFKEKGNLATVTFTAYILSDGRDATFTERSYFDKVKDRWLYRAGNLGISLVSPELKILSLTFYGNPILREKAKPIEVITPEIKHLVEGMIATMDAAEGLGIAAPQVNHSLRLFVIRTPTGTERANLKLGDVKVFINPTILHLSQEKWLEIEGCLSIPTIRAEVERPVEATIEYTDLDGNLVSEHISGWEAKVILHEYDHIEGILFLDHLPEDKQKELAPSLKRLEERLNLPYR